MANQVVYQGSINTTTLISKFKTPSFENLIDYETQTNAADAYLYSKPELRKLQEKGELGGSTLKADRMGVPSNDWDNAIWELSTDDNLAKRQAAVITEFLANPKYEWSKNDGQNGGLRFHSVDGKRQTLYALHIEADGNHLHTITSVYAINNKEVIQAGTFNNSNVRSVILTEINKRLETENLPKLELFNYLNKKAENENSKPSTAAKNETRALLGGQKTLDEILDSPAFKDVNKDFINSAIQNEEQELAKLIEKANAKKESILKLKEAAEVSDKYNILISERDNLIESNNVLTQTIQEKQQEIESITSSLQTQLQDKDVYIENLQIEKGELNIIISNKEEEIQNLNNKYIEVDELYNQSEKELTVAYETIESQKLTINNLNSSFEATKQNHINEIERLNQLHNQRMEELQKSIELKVNEAISKALEEQKANIEKDLVIERQQTKELKTEFIKQKTKLTKAENSLTTQTSEFNKIKEQFEELRQSNSSLDNAYKTLQEFVSKLVDKLGNILTTEQKAKVDLSFNENKEKAAEENTKSKKANKYTNAEIDEARNKMKEKAAKDKQAKIESKAKPKNKKDNDDFSPV